MRTFGCRTVQKASIALCALFLLKTIAYARADEPTPQAFDIGPQPLAQALTAFARQSHEEILFAPDVVAAKRTAGVKGTMTPLIALKALLKDTGLPITSTPNGALLVGNPTPDTTQSAAPALSPSEDSHTQEVGKSSSQDFRVAQVAQANAGPQAIGQGSEKKKEEGLAEIVVTGSRLARTAKEGAQEVKTYTQETIEQSGQTTVSDFLNTIPQVSLAASESGTCCRRL